MRVIVTGATGNLGTSVVQQLIDDPNVTEIVGIARRLPTIKLPKVTWRRADVAIDNLITVFKDADAVIHLAWQLRPSHQMDRLHAVNVEGSKRVFDAAAAAKVKAVVYASSVGVYSPGPKSPVDESHPHNGVNTSTYGNQKAAVEHYIDVMEAKYPDTRWVRMRPGLIFKHDSAEHIRRLFFGSLYPIALLRKKPLPVMPNVEGLVVNVVHADDVARAFYLAITKEVSGAFNIATDTALDVPAMARVAGALTIPMPAPVLRAVADLAWRAHLQPTEAGWIDLALQTPLLNSSRAKDELGWAANISAEDAFRELIDGLRHAGNADTPPLIHIASTGAKTAAKNGAVLLRKRLFNRTAANHRTADQADDWQNQ